MFEPEKLLKFVETIRREPKLQDEAGIRTAINRSYYSSFLQAKSTLESQGMIFSNDETIHQEVIESVKEKSKFMADKLNELYDQRIKSDFDLEYEPQKDLIAPLYGLSKSFNTKVESTLS